MSPGNQSANPAHNTIILCTTLWNRSRLYKKGCLKKNDIFYNNRKLFIDIRNTSIFQTLPLNIFFELPQPWRKDNKKDLIFFDIFYVKCIIERLLNICQKMKSASDLYINNLLLVKHLMAAGLLCSQPRICEFHKEPIVGWVKHPWKRKCHRHECGLAKYVLTESCFLKGFQKLLKIADTFTRNTNASVLPDSSSQSDGWLVGWPIRTVSGSGKHTLNNRNIGLCLFFAASGRKQGWRGRGYQTQRSLCRAKQDKFSEAL